MKNKIWLLIVALLVVSLACVGNRGKETPSPTSETASPGDVVEATATPSTEKQAEPTEKPVAESTEKTEAPTAEKEAETDDEDAELSDIKLAAWEALDSYRGTVTMAFEGAEGATGEIAMTQEATKDPLAMRYLITIQGQVPGQEMLDTDEENIEIEVIQIEDQQWIRFGEMWMQTSGENSAAVEDIAQFIPNEKIDQLLEDKRVKYVGKEKINGVQTRHYHGEYNEWLGELLGRGQNIEDGQMDIWIADEAGLPHFAMRTIVEVEGVLETEGETDTSVEGKMTMTQEIQEINPPITITAPENVDSGLPDDVPAYPNTESMSAFGGMITFQTGDSADDVTDFYKDALPGSGWTEQEASFMGPTWEKDGRTLSLIVSEDDADMTSVVITITEEE